MSQSITNKSVWWVALPLLAILFGLFAPEDSYGASCLKPVVFDQDTGEVYAFHKASDGTLVGAQKGLFRLKGNNLVRIGKVAQTGRVRTFHPASDGTLVGTNNGLFRREGDTLVRIGDGQDTGWVLALHPTNGGILVGTQNGLFRREGDTLVRIGEAAKTGWVRAFHPASGGTLVGTQKGLFRLEGDTLVRIANIEETGSVGIFHKDSEGTLVGTDVGPFRLEGDGLARIGDVGDTGEVYAFHKAIDGALIGAENGLFRRKGDTLVRILDEVGDTRWVRTFHKASDGTLLVGTQGGLFRRKDDTLVRIGEVEDTTGEVYAFAKANDGTLLVGSRRGLFRRKDDTLVSIGEVGDTGRFWAFHDAGGGTLLAGADKGLFRRDGDALVRIGKVGDTGRVRALYKTSDGTLLVGSRRGLFRRKDDTLVRIGEVGDTGEVYAFDKANDGTLVGAQKGLFRLKGNNLVRIGADRETAGRVNVIHAASDGALLVGAEKGLFRREGDTLVRIVEEKDTGTVRAFHKASDGTLLVGAKKGVFRRKDDTLVRIGTDRNTGKVWTFHKASDGTLVGALNGLYRRDGDALVRIGRDGNTAFVRALHKARNGTLMVGALNGLFRREGNTLVRIVEEGVTGRVWAFHNASDGTLVGAHEGMFRLIQRPWTEANVKPDGPSRAYPEEREEFRWIITHPCSFALSPTWKSFIVNPVIPTDWIKSIDVSDDAQEGGLSVYASIAFGKKSGTPYRVQLVAKEDDGTVVPLGDPVSVLVDWGFPEYAWHWGPWLGLVLLLFHTAVFTALIIGARWSPWCWKVLTHPVWGKMGLWFHSVLRHVGPIQRWIMTPWFEAVRKETCPQPYLPMSLSDDGQVVARSTDLLDHAVAPSRLWVLGNAGMGKTAMVLYLQSVFFADPDLPTLSKAFARFRSIPIIVSLRDYRTVDFDRGQWVTKIARQAVSADGLPFEDHSLFRAMIASGGFLLILDGANEVEEKRKQEIEQFGRSAPDARLLVTSQQAPNPNSSFFTNWRLPNSIGEEIKPLLCLYLGQETGEHVFARIESTPLRDAIQSGYDVRLIADLVENQGPDVALPEDRLGLYQLVLDTIRMPDGSKFPEERLCKAAWRMWKDGERKLIPGTHLDEDLLDPLTQKDQKVLRILKGQHYEFRHDQMRAYLAARWAATHETQPISLFEKEADDIWRLMGKEQDEVWGFFADMYVAEQPEQAVVLWRWSTKHRDRGNLQYALQRALEHSQDPALLQNALASLVAS